VRDLYTKTPPRGYGPFAGLFTSLVDTKPKAVMLIGIAVICVVILIMTYAR